ncbi:hypothetical protein D0C36_21590 [Mucilaginibacter conchicola]|uniref:Lipoprotein n=1 Tax=Mucilaginibacter conchicola TaxID=2303333 RepID=A0A372NNE2_9SPHI|nr:hypothetical protein [Mucilaginibacter conchicola]RFZ90388.1 hypothetical protein D0C36_21590 [Mucilaginibacter conchicola]
MKPILLISMFLMLCACRHTAAVKNWQKGYIDRLGTYTNEKENLTLHTWEEDGLLRYQLSKAGKVLVSDDEHASIYSRWFAWLDNEDQLWIYSGDIGPWVWLKNKSGNYQKYQLTALPPGVYPPPVMMSNFPSRLQNKVK